MSTRDNRVRNWKHYNESLVRRGSVTLWFDEKVIQTWHAQAKTGQRGRPSVYGDVAIECGLTLRALFHLSLRATEGFIESLAHLMRISLPIPDYTTLCRRQKTLVVKLHTLRRGKRLDLVVDSTGIKVFGEGEWQVRQHGKTKVRTWRKVHLLVNAVTQQIEASEATLGHLQDCEGLPLVLSQVSGQVRTVIGDGADDRFSCYEEMEKNKSRGIFPAQRNAALSSERKENRKKASIKAVQARDTTIKQIREMGRTEWKVHVSYHRRSLSETAMFRLKQHFGGRFRSREMERQQTELRIWCKALNRMMAMNASSCCLA